MTTMYIIYLYSWKKKKSHSTQQFATRVRSIFEESLRSTTPCFTYYLSCVARHFVQWNNGCLKKNEINTRLYTRWSKCINRLNPYTVANASKTSILLLPDLSRSNNLEQNSGLKIVSRNIPRKVCFDYDMFMKTPIELQIFRFDMILYRHVRREFRRMCTLGRRCSFVYVRRRWMGKKNNVQDTKRDWLTKRQICINRRRVDWRKW